MDRHERPDDGENAKKRIVLVGAGHAHLYSLRRASEFAERGFELVVVAPEDFWYSGLATGVLAGIYPPAFDRIDIAALLKGSETRLIRQAMTGLDLSARRVLLEDGTSIAFGALSLNLGSAVPLIPGTSDRVFPVKPVTRLIALRATLEEDFREGRKITVAIAGAGVTGCEVAAAVAAFVRQSAAAAEIVVYGDRILSDLPKKGAERVRNHLRHSGVKFRSGRVMTVDEGRLTLADGSEEPFDYLINATGLKPPQLISTFGLQTSADGALIVDATLMSPGAEGVFAAGDCIAFGGGLPRVGVYAIRQSPILFHNLMAFLDGGDLQRFVPQQRYLSIMTLGGGKGFAYRAGLWSQGRAAFWLKDWIDRRFLAAHQPQQQTDSGTNRDVVTNGNEG